MKSNRLIWTNGKDAGTYRAYLKECPETTLATITLELGRYRLLAAFQPDNEEWSGNIGEMKEVAQAEFDKFLAMVEPHAETFRLCREAVLHCLDAIAGDSRKFWLMGSGTGSRAKLLAAYAAMSGSTDDDLNSCWLPNERNYNAYVAQKEHDERLLEYCRENGIAAPEED